MSPEWRRDSQGESLWDGETFLGCIYSRDPHGGPLGNPYSDKGYQVLLGEDLKPVGPVVPTRHQPDAREAAKLLLETECGVRKMPTAAEILEAWR